MNNEELLRLATNPYTTKEELEAAIRKNMEATAVPPIVVNVPAPAAPDHDAVKQYACATGATLGPVLDPNTTQAAQDSTEQIPQPIMKLGKKTHIDGVTKRGFAFSMSVDAMNDMELLEDLGCLDDDPTRLPGIINKILGEDQKKLLYNFLRDPRTGRVPIEAVSETVADIFAAAGTAGKN